MKMIKAITLVAMTGLSNSVFSLDQDVSVCALQSETTGDTAFLGTCGERKSVNGCDSGLYVTWDMKSHQGSAMYSTALAALMGDKKVKVRLDGETCNGRYDVTRMIRIIK